jgi:hypothetical protein
MSEIPFREILGAKLHSVVIDEMTPLSQYTLTKISENLAIIIDRQNTKGTSLPPSENSERTVLTLPERIDYSLSELCERHGINPKECCFSNYTMKVYARNDRDWKRYEHNWIRERMIYLMKKFHMSLKEARDIADNEFTYSSGGEFDDYYCEGGD